MADLRNLSKKELLDTFDKFWLAIDFRIEHFKIATKDDAYDWNFSLQSFNQLEDFILKNNIDENHALYDDIASYIGEVVRRNYGGQWECCLDKKENSMLYGWPVIAGWNKYEVLFCPYESLRLFLFRKEKGMLLHNIEIVINPPNFEEIPVE